MTPYTQVKESTEIPTMTVIPGAEQVVIGDDEDMVLVANDPPMPEILDRCLATIEAYIETVRDQRLIGASEEFAE